MRIFYAAANSPNPYCASTLWRRNLHDSLAAMGHEIVEFDFDLAETYRNLDPADAAQREFIRENRPRLTAELLLQLGRAHAREPVRLFFSYFYDACVEPAALDEIRRLGITTVNWFCNASFQLHLVSQISPHYDWCLVPEKCRLPDYAALGAHPVYCQEAANPDVYRSHDLPAEFDVTFAGQAYGERPALIRFLLENEIDVRVWGPQWEYHVVPPSRNPLRRVFFPPPGIPASRYRGVLSDDDLVRLYSRSRINLGLSACANAGPRTVQIRLRDFEVPMSGGFYLTEYQPELSEFFDFGREIETYRDRSELLDKVRFYLRNESARDRVRCAGRERCLRDHTWQRRFETAFAAMNLA
jgi:spore maturation protein CgeB